MAIPTLAMIPSGYKAGKLYSVLPSDGTGDFTVARNSKATRVNQSGLIEEVDVNVPRLDYSAGGCPVLLTEIQSQNLILYSQSISLSPTKNGTFTDNFAISPDGTQNATKLTATDVDPFFYQNISFSAGSYTASIYVKGIGSSIGKDFRFAIGSSSHTGNKYKIPSEWTRFEFTATMSSGSSNTGLEIIDPASVGDEVLVWGWQVEAQPAATSYIKSNTGSVTTREADFVNGAGSAATFNSLEHTLFIDLNSVFQSGTLSGISIVGSTGTVTDNRIMVLKESNNTEFRIQTRSGGATVATETLANIDFSVRQKLTITLKENEVKYYRNGFLVGTDIGTIPMPVSLGQLTLTIGDTSFPFYASTKDIRYYNQVLTAAETLELMSYDSFNEMASALQYTIK